MSPDHSKTQIASTQKVLGRAEPVKETQKLISDVKKAKCPLKSLQ